MVKDPTDRTTKNMWPSASMTVAIGNDLIEEMGLFSRWDKLPKETRPPYWEWLHDRKGSSDAKA